jgi:D-alanyl-D-alanine carboxypeptidase-like protein
VLRLGVVAAALVLVASAAAAVHPLPPLVQQELVPEFWHKGCPVPLSHLRVLTVRYVDWNGRTQTGELIVNEDVTAKLALVFRKLYALRFPIRHMSIQDYYGPKSERPKDDDVTESFECRQASASPCGGLAQKTTGHWSEHAYGHAIDLNSVENPYVGCGQSRDPRAKPYFDRSRLRKGMVTPAVVAAFRSIGWGWGGSWAGDTKDYMHFSASGH